MADVVDSSSMWMQGDVCLDVAELPVLVSHDGQAEFINVAGVVIISQTCDLVRSHSDRPRFQAAGLVQATAEEVEAVRRFGKPQFAYVPQVADRGLVADLDLVASFDKSILPGWSRLPFPDDPIIRRDFGYALGRHKSRSAFPDRWAVELGPLRNWLRSRSSKKSDEGEFALAIEQMRIIANDVDCPEEAHIMCLIPHTTAQATRGIWAAKMLPKLASKIDEAWGCQVTFTLVTTSEITAADYLAGRRLDFDALSMAA